MRCEVYNYIELNRIKINSVNFVTFAESYLNVEILQKIS